MENRPDGSGGRNPGKHQGNLSERLTEMSERLQSSLRLLSSISALTSIPARIEPLQVAAKRITETISCYRSST